jgi:hypothetical protein
MSSPQNHPKRWLHSSVFGLWACSLSYLLFTQRYTAFLRPEFGLLLVIALCLSIGFMAVSVRTERVGGIEFAGLMRALVLMLPILYMTIMPKATLGRDSFIKRFIGSTPVTENQAAESNPPIPNLES